MKTTAEMNNLFGDIPEALDSTMEIYDKVRNYSIDQPLHLPKPTLPKGVDEITHLSRLVFTGANKHYNNPLPAEVQARLNDELKVIQSKGIASLFLMLHEIISAARTMGTPVVASRNTMACSAVAYCLGVTDTDPIECGLEFEKFISPNNNARPEISFYIDDRGREHLLQWIVQRYGEECVANIATPIRMTRKRALKAVSAAYDIAEKQIGTDILPMAEGIVGVVCNATIHPSGIAICDADISQYVPLAAVKSHRYKNMVIATQYNDEDLYNAGVIAFNILSSNEAWPSITK
jgi:DNA polymerase-3 subunit alpha